jgi:hypothetical protein
MAIMPDTYDGVRLDFHPNVNKNVASALLSGLAQIVRPGIPARYLVRSLFIRSASDSHTMPSRHAQHKAIDIAAINGKPILGNYGRDPEVTEIVKRIQEGWEDVPGRRENFGPLFKKKLGKPYPVSDHNDHIHLSVD